MSILGEVVVPLVIFVTAFVVFHRAEKRRRASHRLGVDPGTRPASKWAAIFGVLAMVPVAIASVVNGTAIGLPIIGLMLIGLVLVRIAERRADERNNQ